MIEVGNQAEDFSLSDESEESFTLSDQRGKWVVLYFYPRDNTPGCTTEALEFTALGGEFEAVNARVVGVSPDSCASHQKFTLKHGLSITLLSDPDRKVMKTYGAWGEKKMYGKTALGVIRSTVLIDPRGHIAHHWSKVKARGHAAEVLETLRSLS